MRLLVDMNLSPEWVSLLETFGWESIHWSQIGKPNAPDGELFDWAREKDHVVLTQDLDFSQLLYATQLSGPSVVLLRLDNEFDSKARDHVMVALKAAQQALSEGALLTVSAHRTRLRRLPISPSEG
jgi:predicted nuclease of predicted toxin-antitoxin system